MVVADDGVEFGADVAGEQDGGLGAGGAVVAEHLAEEGAGDALAAVGWFDVHGGAPGGVADRDGTHPAYRVVIDQGGVLAER